LIATDPRLWSADAPLFLRDYDGERLVADETGLELDGVDAARLAAQKALPDLARATLPDGNFRAFLVNTRDETGQGVMRLALSLVIEGGTLDD
jgi:hypothetical protein